MAWVDCRNPGGSNGSTALALVGALFMSHILDHALIYANAPVTVGAVLYEKKPWKLWILNNGYWLVSLLVSRGRSPRLQRRDATRRSRSSSVRTTSLMCGSGARPSRVEDTSSCIIASKPLWP